MEVKGTKIYLGDIELKRCTEIVHAVGIDNIDRVTITLLASDVKRSVRDGVRVIVIEQF